LRRKEVAEAASLCFASSTENGREVLPPNLHYESAHSFLKPFSLGLFPDVFGTFPKSKHEQEPSIFVSCSEYSLEGRNYE